MPNRDTLWKGIIEDLAEDMLWFFFPEYAGQIDFLKGFVFLDKELQQLFPESREKLRHADKLIKIWLLSGQEQWFLLHIEVQGYRDTHFAERMFQSAYRIKDRFQQPVAALAIYTDSSNLYQPDEYRYEMMGTYLVYHFNTFKLSEFFPGKHPFAETNIFAIVLEAAKAGLGKKPDDKTLVSLKLNLVRKFINRGFSAEKVRRVLNFIRYYVRFEKSEEMAIFEQQLDELIQNRKNMGIEEAILAEAKQEGLEEGIAIGMEKGIEKGLEEGIEKGIEKGVLLQKKQIILKGASQGLSLALLSTLTELTEQEVKDILNNNQ